MSINDATPADWDRVRNQHPAIEKTGLESWMKQAHEYVDPYDQPHDQPPTSMIDKPPHYNAGEIECIDYLEDNLGLGFEYYREGNIKKYLHRFRHKGSEIADLKKARWYLDRLIHHNSQED